MCGYQWAVITLLLKVLLCRLECFLKRLAPQADEIASKHRRAPLLRILLADLTITREEIRGSIMQELGAIHTRAGGNKAQDGGHHVIMALAPHGATRRFPELLEQRHLELAQLALGICPANCADFGSKHRPAIHTQRERESAGWRHKQLVA